MLSDIKHKLMCITSKLQIKQSNGISNPTFEKSHLNSNLYILQNRLNRCLQTIPVKDYIFSISDMKRYLDFRYGIYSETIPLLILSAFLSYSLRMERLSGLFFTFHERFMKSTRFCA